MSDFGDLDTCDFVLVGFLRMVMPGEGGETVVGAFPRLGRDEFSLEVVEEGALLLLLLFPSGVVDTLRAGFFLVFFFASLFSLVFCFPCRAPGCAKSSLLLYLINFPGVWCPCLLYTSDAADE